MALRVTPLSRAGIRPHHFLGGDREVVIGFGILGVALIFHSASLLGRASGVLVWLFGLSWARAMVKRDPLWRQVWQRRRLYRGVYLARSTPFRANDVQQGGRYRA